MLTNKSGQFKYYSFDSSAIRFMMISAFLSAAISISSSTVFAQNTYDPWLSYRSLALDDLKIALAQTDQRLETLRVEVARSEKLVRSGASSQAELMELSGELQIKIAEREDLDGLIRWMDYLMKVSTLNSVTDETEYFEKLTGLLKPRVTHAKAVTGLSEKRYAMKAKLRERRAISIEEFERATDELEESRLRQLLYQAQYLSAQYALEVRQDKRAYDENAALVLAKSVTDARIRLWEGILNSISHRLSRLEALRERGIVAQAEIDAIRESEKTIRLALENARKATPDPHPAPGKLKRLQSQNI